MAEIVDIQSWRERKVAEVSSAPALACPTCETDCAATVVAADGTTTYRCAGNGHRALTWRIDADGNMLRGAVGRRFY